MREFYDTQRIRQKKRTRSSLWGLLCGLGIDYQNHRLSSPQKPERPPCGPGPPQSCGRRGNSEPGPVPKSYSLDGGGSTPPGRGSTRGRSGSYHQSHQGKSRVSPRTNDEVLKKTRMQGYELSPDLADKQLEMLERKYGGAVRARNAALTIQRAFRRYAMMKKFSMITQQAKQEKRLSRRFQTVDLTAANGDSWLVGPSTPSSGEWDRSANRSCDATDPELIIKNNNLSQLMYRDLDNSVGSCRSSRPSRSQSLKESRMLEDVNQTKDYDVTLNGSGAYPSGLRSNVYHASPKRDDGWYEGSARNTSTPKGGDPMMGGWYEEDDSVYHTPCWGGVMNTAMSPMMCGQESPIVSEQSYHTPRESLSTDSGISSLYDSNGVRHGGTYGDIHSRRRGNKNLPPQTPPTRRTPPEVPRRTSSIGRGDNLSSDVASLSSGGSDSSLSMCADRTTPSTEGEGDHSPVPTSLWKKKPGQTPTPCELSATPSQLEDKRLSNISETSEESIDHSSSCNHAHCHTYQTTPPTHGSSVHSHSQPLYKVPEVIRKRQYRVGLNLFNKKPEKGINYLIRRGFLDSSPQSVAKFLISRKGLSKQMIGEYLGNLQNAFNMSVLECFAAELNLSGLQVDVALRRFQTFFRLPGEAQKIERLVEVFAQRYCQCNRDVISRLCSPDTMFVLAFAVIMLNTDLHTPNIKPERKMKPDDFIKNLRGIDEGNDIDRETLLGIYERIRSSEFKPGSDHVTQVMKVQQTIVGKKPHLSLPHRRLVCYCRLYEVPDLNKKERPGVHQREVFLFNDLLVVTKIFSKKKNSVTYSFRESFSLCGLQVSIFQVPYYSFGIKLTSRVDNKVLITFNARNEHDRSKFVEDLKESVCEMDEMENLRIEAGLERQQRSTRMRTTENRDSGVADIEVLPNGKEPPMTNGNSSQTTSAKNGNDGSQLKRSALSNSLLDIHDIGEKPQRRGSIGSLDSGMSVSFQSSSNSTVSRDSSPQAAAPAPKSVPHQSSFLRLFDRNKKDSRSMSKSDGSNSAETCA